MRHGLVLSGGGAKGSWEAGAAAAILNHYEGTDEEIRFLSGTSVGGLNAAGIASMGMNDVLDLWYDIEQKDVYRSGSLWRLYSRSSWYDSSPLWKTIQRKLRPQNIRASKYRIFVHATLLEKRQSVVFTNESVDLLLGVYAGGSVPGAFPPVKWRGQWLVDGGVINNSPIRTLIYAGCEKITIVYLDHLLPAHPTWPEQVFTTPEEQDQNLLDVISGSLDAMMDAMFWRDLRLLELINEAVAAGAADKKYRHIDFQVIKPDHELGGTLDFSKDLMRRQLLDGHETALRELGVTA